jgi:ectoine hydrolase
MHRRILYVADLKLRKCDLVAKIYDAAQRGADGYDGDCPAIVPLAPLMREHPANPGDLSQQPTRKINRGGRSEP